MGLFRRRETETTADESSAEQEESSDMRSWLDSEAAQKAKADADSGDEAALAAYATLLHVTSGVEALQEYLAPFIANGITPAMVALGRAYAYEDDATEPETVRPILERAAALGNAEAMFLLAGSAFRNDDAETEARWLDEAAKLDYVPALELLGRHAFEADNADEAEALFKRASALGSADAEYWFGLWASSRADNDLARKHMLTASDRGSADAAYFLARLDLNANNTEGFSSWMARAVELGHPDALLYMGLDAVDQGDRDRGRGIFERGVDEFEHPSAMRELGVLEREDGNVERAMSLFHAAADQDNTHAMYDIGIFHEYRGELEQAREWYQRGADLDDSDCQRAVGVIQSRLGDSDSAVGNLMAAAEKGDAEAMYQLVGTFIGVGDLEQAQVWCERTVATGNQDALVTLGWILEEAGNQDEADAVYRRAADAGSPTAMYNLGNNARRAAEHYAFQHWGEAEITLEAQPANEALDEALRWLTMASDAGEAAGALLVGKIEEGRGSLLTAVGAREADADAAVRAYTRAGELGEPAGYGFVARVEHERGDYAACLAALERGREAAAEIVHVVNAEEIAEERPEQFRIPPRERRESLAIDDFAKLMYQGDEGIERMWTTVLARVDDRYLGVLDNDPDLLTIKEGTVIEFGPEHVMNAATPDEMNALREEQGNSTRVEQTPGGVTRDAYLEIVAAAEAGEIDAIRQCVSFAAADDNAAERRQWIERGVAQNDNVCLDLLGGIEEEEGNAAAAMSAWQRAAQLGNTASMYSLAATAEAGEDPQEAVKWLERAFSAGSFYAAAAIADFAKRAGDTETQRAWLERGAKEGVTDCLGKLSYLEFEHGRYRQARALMMQAHELGDERAQEHIDYLDEMIEREDDRLQELEAQVGEMAARADAGDVDAMRWMAYYYQKTDNPASRRSFLEMGAQAGDPASLDLLGDLHEELGDMETAAQLWLRGAEGGDRYSMASLAGFYIGENDLDQGRLFLERAVIAGHGRSALVLAMLAVREGELIDVAVELLERGAHCEDPLPLSDTATWLMEIGELALARSFAEQARDKGEDGAEEILAALNDKETER